MDLKERLDALQPRERKLLLLMATSLSALLVFILVMETVSAFQERADEIESYRSALVHLRKNQAQYAYDKVESQQQRARLKDASSSPGTEISSMAKGIGFDVNVTPKDAQPATSKFESGVLKQDIEVTIPKVERGQFIEFLNQLDAFDEPLYVRSLTVRRGGRGPNMGTTPLSVNMTIAAYRLE